MFAFAVASRRKKPEKRDLPIAKNALTNSIFGCIIAFADRKTVAQGCRQAVRQRTLTPLCDGSIPSTPAKKSARHPSCRFFNSSLFTFSRFTSQFYNIIHCFPCPLFVYNSPFQKQHQKVTFLLFSIIVSLTH